MLLLAGDIGGTSARMSLVEFKNDSLSRKPFYEKTYSCSDSQSLAEIVDKFLKKAKEKEQDYTQPTKACFAIAGPVVNNTCEKISNLGHWPRLEAEGLQQELKIEKVSLINDFAAVGYGIQILDKNNPKDLEILQDAEPQPDAPLAIIGAGTGLGKGYVTREGGTYNVGASEGGHADFAARTELEFELLLYLQERYNISHVSVERVLSGPGIVDIFKFLRDRKFPGEPVGEILDATDPAEAIAKAAAEKSNFLSVRTMQIFIEAYGADAGNLALYNLPYGGLYIAGGIAAKNIQLMKDSSFLKTFKEKGRLSSVMEKVPVYVVMNEAVGLIGAANYAATK